MQYSLLQCKHFTLQKTHTKQNNSVHVYNTTEMQSRLLSSGSGAPFSDFCINRLFLSLFMSAYLNNYKWFRAISIFKGKNTFPYVERSSHYATATWNQILFVTMKYLCITLADTAISALSLYPFASYCLISHSYICKFNPATWK